MNYDLETLESSKKRLENMIKCIEDIEQGVTEDIACAKYDIREHHLRQILFSNNRTVEYVPSPEEKIYQQLFGVQQNPLAFPSDLKETIPYIMEEFLTEEEQDIMRKKYWNNESYANIAKDYDAKVYKIQQIERSALSKLKDKRSMFIVEYGLKYMTIMDQMRNEATEARRNENIKTCMNEYVDKQKELINKLKKDIDSIKDDIIKNIEKEMDSMS